MAKSCNIAGNDALGCLHGAEFISCLVVRFSLIVADIANKWRAEGRCCLWREMDICMFLIMAARWLAVASCCSVCRWLEIRAMEICIIIFCDLCIVVQLCETCLKDMQYTRITNRSCCWFFPLIAIVTKQNFRTRFKRDVYHIPHIDLGSLRETARKCRKNNTTLK